MNRPGRRFPAARTLLLAAALAALATVSAAARGTREPGAENRLEIFSWWTAGGEAEGLAALFDIYHARFTTTSIVNATVAGGAGSNAKAVLRTRMLEIGRAHV